MAPAYLIGAIILSLLLLSKLLNAQEELLPKVAWRTDVENVTMLTDSTYRVSVSPININEPGAYIKGDYLKDYVGHTYEIIDSTFNTVDIWDCFNVGVGPQQGLQGVLYKSVDGSPYLAPIYYTHLNKTALDYSRAIELAVLWKEASLYAKDSANLVWWKDTITDISTRYDIDTLHQKTIDSILIHRTEINDLKNQSDSLSSIEPATTLEAQTGTNDVDYITPQTSKEQTDLNSVRYYGNKEDVYLNGFKLVADSVIVKAVRTWLDSLVLHGNVHVTDTLTANKLQLMGGYADGYYLKVNSHGNIIAEAISGALVYQGVWDATTNTPTLTDGTGTNGHFYRVDTQWDSIYVNLGSGEIPFFSGDDIIYNGETWEKMPNLGFVLQVATATVLGGVKKGDNVNIAADGTISITKQTLTAGSNSGQLSISEGNSVTINVDDADHSSTNELQNLTWNETTGDLAISSGTGDNLDGRYTLITDWQDSVIYFTNRLSEHSDSLIQLFAENDVQSDSIQLLSDSLFYYVLTATFEDSLLQLRGDMNSDFSTVSDSLSYYVLTTVFNDSLAIFRQDVSDLQDTVSVHLDTLQSHNLRILALSNNINQLDLSVYDSLNVHHGRISVNEVDIAAIYDSLTNIYTDAQVNALLSEINARNDLQGDSISDLWAWNEGQDDTIQINSDSIDVLADLIANIETITELATILEAQSGVSDKLMTALRTAEQLTLNAVPYYNVKEDIYSNFDATFDSIFASNLYQETISTSITGMGGVYDKEVSTNNIEVYLNGVLQRENVNYTQTETQITFIKTPLASDYITIKYKQ
jgi:hypothetical protein